MESLGFSREVHISGGAVRKVLLSAANVNASAHHAWACANSLLTILGRAAGSWTLVRIAYQKLHLAACGVVFRGCLLFVRNSTLRSHGTMVMVQRYIRQESAVTFTWLNHYNAYAVCINRRASSFNI